MSNLKSKNMKKIYFKNWLVTIILLSGLYAQAQDYLVTFAIEGGGSCLVDSVLVENIDQGTYVTLNGDGTLRLLYDITTDITDIRDENNTLMIYPNPSIENTTIEFYNQKSGDVSIRIFDVTGRAISQRTDNMPNGHMIYKLSGLSNGAYFINVSTLNSSNTQSITIISQMGTSKQPYIELESFQEGEDESQSIKSVTLATDYIEMQYNDGEVLKFTVWNQGFITDDELIITESQTINFDFPETVIDIECNMYQTVTIGNQTWMAENLRSTKYNDGTGIPNVLGDLEWEGMTTPAYCWAYNDQEFAEENNFGALYNWYTVNTGNLCPNGWHVPTHDEFAEFVFFLAANGYNYDGTTYTGNDLDEAGSKVGKAIAIDSGWVAPTYGLEWAIGKDQYLNNSSGFNGVGADGRYLYGGVFLTPFYIGNWWTSTSYDTDDALTFFIYTEEGGIFNTYYFKQGGYNVRCVKD